MKKGIQLVALLLTVFMGSCTGGKDKAACGTCGREAHCEAGRRKSPSRRSG